MAKLYQDEKLLMFGISSTDLEISNTSRVLYFELNTYDYDFPIYYVVLDFINSMGEIN